MKKIGFTLMVLPVFYLGLFLSAAPVSKQRPVVFQVSTLGALMAGVFDGAVTLGELKAHGDFGIGTYEGLDGEMLLLDGVFYQVRADGGVYRPGDNARSPFAVVTRFGTADRARIEGLPGMNSLQAYINGHIPSGNLIYAIKIEGTFPSVRTRSVPAQKKPYPSLAEATKNQAVFSLTNVKGTIIGFWFPEYGRGINLPGCHLHFITDDRKAGGHLLDCAIQEGTVSIEAVYSLDLELPESNGFAGADLSGDKRKDIDGAEK